MLLLAALLPCVAAQWSLPIIADTSFSLLSGEVVASRQLTSWGISLGLPVDSRRSRERSRRLQLDLSATVDFGSASPPAFDASGAQAIEESSMGWGRDENVARGERGDTSWYTYISIGSPPQSLPVLPDTGSSDLFVFGPECTECYLSNHTFFSASNSSTFTNDSYDWTIGYGDGTTAAGYLGTDLLVLSDDLSTSILFGIAETVSSDSVAISARSGIMGLGLDPLASMEKDKAQGATVFSRLVQAGKLEENVLGIRLDKGEHSQGEIWKEGSGRYTFGGIEEDYVLGGRAGLAWATVSSLNFWGFTMDDISVGMTSILVSDTTTPRRAIIDTGTSLILTSAAAAAAIHARISGSFQVSTSGMWYIPCSTSAPLAQNLFVTISGRRFGVPMADLAWKVSDTYSGLCISGVQVSGRAIRAMADSQGGMESFTVLGDMFIKNHYIVLSYGDSGTDLQVGLGDRIDVPPIL